MTEDDWMALLGMFDCFLLGMVVGAILARRVVKKMLFRAEFIDSNEDWERITHLALVKRYEQKADQNLVHAEYWRKKAKADDGDEG